MEVVSAAWLGLPPNLPDMFEDAGGIDAMPADDPAILGNWGKGLKLAWEGILLSDVDRSKPCQIRVAFSYVDVNTKPQYKAHLAFF